MEELHIKHKIARESKKFEKKDGGLKVHELEGVVVHKDDANKIQVVAVGPSNTKETLSVLLLGETGAGKTCVINTAMNMFYGVSLGDNFRFLLKDQMELLGRTQIHSQTDYVTCYHIYHQDGMKGDCNLMMIDTPGFNDTRGEGHQKVVTERISKFLLNEFGIDSLHCIGLVAKANENRISKIQVEILNEFSLHLANDLSPITQLLATFASDDNFVCEVVREAGVKYSGMYEFDNWPLYISYQLDPNVSKKTKGNHEYRWANMQTEYFKFFKELREVEPVSLKRTRELQKEKKMLENTKIELIDEVQHTSKVVQSLNKLKGNLHLQQSEADEIVWTYFEDEVVLGRLEVQEGYHAHNCKKCSRTCVNICEDPSNVRAGLIGTATGVGTATATGILSAIGSGVAIGTEVGLFGGPIGIIVGSTLGAATGLAVGLVAGIKSRRNKLQCPIAKAEQLCEVANCSHKLSDHTIENEIIVETTESKEKVDQVKKNQHDSIMDKVSKTQSFIRKEEEKMRGCEENLMSLAMTIVNHLKQIDELSLKSNCITSESIINELMHKIRGDEATKILNMYLRALKLLQDPQSKEKNNGLNLSIL